MSVTRTSSIKIYLFCAIAGMLLGGYLGQAAIDVMRRSDAVPWKKMAVPPSPPTALLDADIYRIFIQTEQGIYLSMGMDHCLDTNGGSCWSHVDKVDSALLYLLPCSGSHFFTPPDAPVAFSQSLMAQECGPDSFGEAYYVLGADGAIWFWRYGSYTPGTVSTVFLATVIGAILGLVVGLIAARQAAAYFSSRD